jgi:hypothetical protein
LLESEAEFILLVLAFLPDIRSEAFLEEGLSSGWEVRERFDVRGLF